MRASHGFSHAVLAGLLIACLGLSACGRKGPLEAPPGAVTDAQQPGAGQAAGVQASGAEGGPGQPAGGVPAVPPPTEPQRSFFLDFLL